MLVREFIKCSLLVILTVLLCGSVGMYLHFLHAGKMAELEGKLQDLKTTLGKRETAVVQAYTEGERIRKDMTSLQATLNSLVGQIAKINSEVAQHKTSLGTSVEALTGPKLETIKNEIASVKSYLETSVQPQIKLILQDIATQKDSLGPQAQAIFRSEMEEVQEAIQSLRTEIEPKFESISRDAARTNASLESVKSNEISSLKSHLEKHKSLLDYLEVITQNNVPQTCQDLKDLGITKSGVYLVDPDGPSGDKPLKVECSFSGEQGVTAISHDAVNAVEVDACKGAGCYARSIKYEASDLQIQALKQASEWCSQQIRVTCIAAPLNANGTDLAWWTGFNGSLNYYWDGRQETPEAEHFCQCGLSNTCLENKKCNCDANSIECAYDEGILTDKTELPVKELRFGGTSEQDPSSWTQYQLGPLLCAGKQQVPQIIDKKESSSPAEPRDSLESLQNEVASFKQLMASYNLAQQVVVTQYETCKWYFSHLGQLIERLENKVEENEKKLKAVMDKA